MITQRPTESIMPAEAAALLLAWLEARGAIARLQGDDDVRVDLNPIADMTYEKADAFARGILSLRDELRVILIARRIQH
jgi:hypothetical protein